jgi:hypothetical protein
VSFNLNQQFTVEYSDTLLEHLTSPGSPDGSQRILIATKQNAPLDNNTSLVLKGDVLCTANLGFTHAKPEEADRTVVCMKGFPLPK